MNENDTQETGTVPEPTNGPDLGAEFDTLASEAGTDAGPGEAPPPEPEIPTKQAVAFFLSPLFQVIAPNWHVQHEEVEALAEAYAPVIDKYLPGGMGVEGAALMVTVAVFGPRLTIPRKLPPQETATAAPGVKLETMTEAG